MEGVKKWSHFIIFLKCSKRRPTQFMIHYIVTAQHLLGSPFHPFIQNHHHQNRKKKNNTHSHFSFTHLHPLHFFRSTISNFFLATKKFHHASLLKTNIFTLHSFHHHSTFHILTSTFTQPRWPSFSNLSHYHSPKPFSLLFTIVDFTPLYHSLPFSSFIFIIFNFFKFLLI